ncbi:hypothetical protein M0R45_018620 [Rubus argutus]|uniref:Dirigent protein n=1 Tax=Rubus argutus TaxID=59490 RepID=A0AAW1X394_RUBAR
MLLAVNAAVDPVKASGHEPILELYMHDILGGSNPTARPILVCLATSMEEPACPARRFQDSPLGRGQTQLGPDGLGLGFGTITVIDDILTTAPELGSQNVGKAQGVYVASSADGSTQMMAFIAMIEGGEYGDTLNFYGVFKIGSPMSHLSVTGGTGKFRSASGFAEVRSLIPPGQYVTDGEETLLRIIVHLSY